MVGGLPVGIQTKDEDDAPYWPVQSMWTYKEIWVHPVSRWVWLLKDVEGPAMVEGKASGLIIFKSVNTQQSISILADKAGHFKAMIPEGRYVVTSNGNSQTQTFLPGSNYNLDLRSGNFLSYEVSKAVSSTGELVIKVIIKGNGKHVFNIRTDNLSLASIQKEISLKTGIVQNFEWHGKITSEDTPWVAVVIPDGNIGERKEVRGASWEK
jgi:hypothetical protein